ncbi:MAG: PepSY domain-containing protein [Colwellia sp.]|nr:PepSY domain-containing protein [Colwellia sp.]
MFRKIIFWSHLVVGISVGVIVFIMAATGVLLTYEKQIIEWDESRYSIPPQSNEQKLTTDAVLNLVRQKHPDEHHFYIRWLKGDERPVPVWAGHQRYLISPYSGGIVQIGQSWLVESLHWITELHRWLALEGKQQAIAKSITAYSNLLFLFLIVSGSYLWLPRRFSWSTFKSSLLFRRQYNNRQARHFNWHHVFGFWAMVPLFVIVSTATVFHFSWATETLYSTFNEQPPQRKKMAEPEVLVDGLQSYQTLFNAAQQHANENGAQDWYSMWLEIGRESGQVRFYIDRSIGNQPDVAYSLYLDIDTADVVKIKRHSDWSRGDQAWDVARYLHTGEYFGVIGQTIAGLASLAGCFLVYSGFLLSWRRLVSPYLRRLKQPS